MHISIAQRFKPFSHKPGVCCIVPRTVWQVEVFPILLRFKNLIDESSSIEVSLPFKGPIIDFTVEEDLEKELVRVFGRTPVGYMRYIIKEKDQRVIIEFEKLKPSFISEKTPFYVTPFLDCQCSGVSTERLSLGIHKMLDWDLVQRRKEMKEIFPIWLRLSQGLPQMDVNASDEGMLGLLKECKKKILQKEKNEVTAAFLNLFLAGFKGILCPRIHDDDFQGILLPEKKPAVFFSPLFLLTESAHLIRSLFFQEMENRILLLPCLPTEFASGRFTGIVTSEGNKFDLEWSKKLLRRVIFYSHRQQVLRLELQKPLKGFRLRFDHKDRGRMISCNEPIELKAQQTIYLDRFQK